MAYSTRNRNNSGHLAGLTTAHAVTLIDIDEIEVSDKRLRALQPGKVDEIADSMKNVGQLEPILVRRRPGGFHIKKYLLVFGLHRIEAHKKNGAKTILAVVADMDATAAEMAEIDENLIRADLSAAERALHLARRKELYEEQHPETRKGSAGGRAKAGRGAKSQDATKQAPAFIDDTAKKTGKHRATVAREVARAIPNLANAIGTSLDQGAELDALAKLPQPEQAALISRAKAGEKVTAKAAKGNAAVKARKAEPVVGNDTDPVASAELRKAEAAAAAEAVQPEPSNMLQERWQRSLGGHANFTIAMPVSWAREYGDWEKFEVPSGLVTLAKQAAAAWADVVSKLLQSNRAAPASKAPTATPVELPAVPPFPDHRDAESAEAAPAKLPTKH